MQIVTKGQSIVIRKRKQRKYNFKKESTKQEFLFSTKTTLAQGIDTICALRGPYHVFFAKQLAKKGSSNSSQITNI